MIRVIFRAIVLFVVWLLGLAAAPPPSVWTVLAIDPIGDMTDRSLPDAAQLCYRYDAGRDELWIRLSFYEPPSVDTFRIALAIDTGTDTAHKVQWQGPNHGFQYDKLVTATVRHVGGRFEGNADGAMRISGAGQAVLAGVKLAGVTDARALKMIASVGSSDTWSDDIPTVQSAAIDLSTPRPSRNLRELDFDRNNFQYAAGYRTLADSALPRIATRGSGRQAMILVPGVYSGDHAFDSFIARNASRYRFFMVTPPGLGGTPARALPSESTSSGEFTWTRRLERDLLDVITRNHLEKPVLVAHGLPGSLAVESLAAAHPDAIAGVVQIASMPVRPMPTFSSPGRTATPSERITIVDKAWAEQWFKYVTPETWESNNYSAAMLANDPVLAEAARRQLEAVPLPVKIRYLIEFMAADHTALLESLRVPMLALRPAFNAALLAEPANAWFKGSFQDAWDPFSKNAAIEVVTVPDARALMLDDQPAAVDRAIAAFVDLRAQRRTH